jgi:glutathione S-transferase
MITIHHLGHGQSDRIVWLCEELGLSYALRHYTRDPVTRLAPPDLKALHPLGAAPVIEDDGLLLAESAAIVEYLIVKHGNNRFKPGPEHPDYADFLYWFHFANGNLQPVVMRLMTATRAQLPDGHPVPVAARERLDRVLGHMEARLGQAPWLAGDAFTAAEIMSVFTFTTMRLFQPFELGAYPHIRAWLARVGERPAYRRALAKSDPGLVPMLD